MSEEQKKVFLSHASVDAVLATEVRNLLIIGCGVSNRDFLVSSVPGNGIPGGTPSFVDYLKARLQNAEIVVLLLSENFFASQYCLCELGATWALGKPYFPLVVPPLSKSELGATLELAQAGEINSRRYLDQLPEKIRAAVGTWVGVDAWGLQCDVFLSGLDAIIKSLAKPRNVKREELEQAIQKHETAVRGHIAKDEEIKKLKAYIEKLEPLKDQQALKTLKREFSSEDEKFENLCDEAKGALGKLRAATCKALFYDFRGEAYVPEQDDWSDVDAAQEAEEVEVNEGERTYVNAQDEHPLVQQARDAIRELKDFLEDDDHSEFEDELTEQLKFPAKIRNRDFWHKYLAYV